jgi:hypothetical protein
VDVLWIDVVMVLADPPHEAHAFVKHYWVLVRRMVVIQVQTVITAGQSKPGNVWI